MKYNASLLNSKPRSSTSPTSTAMFMASPSGLLEPIFFHWWAQMIHLVGYSRCVPNQPFCRHNAQNTWNKNIVEFAERQRHLKEKSKFGCKCELCSLPLCKRELSDEQLMKIQGIDRFIGEVFLGGGDPVAALNLLRMIFGLFDKEGIWDGTITRAYKDAFNIATENDDAA
ncbi:hypothetical protein ASPCAL14801 [Aspergillus calidoustus]|uniref:Uncharacterized protein n=1 Tax=Aspergillus calidoustus TaxID=454130 RepID=A0A0U5GIP2_ASPCI|nr:hypothetical protein ASPCAL14801 [Aspergillus calidoustus]